MVKSRVQSMTDPDHSKLNAKDINLRLSSTMCFNWLLLLCIRR